MSVNAIAAILIATANALIGGAEQSPGRYPGSINYFLPGAPERCSAVKIAKATFLTAAHCFDHFRDDRVVINGDQPRHIVAHVIHPGYYRTDTLLGNLRDTNMWSNVDLAIMKLDADIAGVSVPPLATTRAHAGQLLLIGGYGPTDVTKDCYSSPCELHMAVAKVTAFSDAEILLGQIMKADPFLTGGDSGGPAYDLSTRHLVVIGINHSSDHLSDPSLRKTSRLTRLDLAWIRAHR